ncbi:TraU family protein, partial [Salmonella enterica]|uniref:TraU family protein n=1 Tax=Salmonella enterica TaxID=28901 RepID=UPI0026DD2635
MKRSLWLCVLILLAGHVPTVSADSSCESRFVNPITDICWSCLFPLSLGSTKVSQGKLPDTANPSMPLQFCPAPPPIFKRPGLAIGYWEPMALTDVTRSPGCMVNLGFSLPAFGKTAQGTAKKEDKQVYRQRADGHEGGRREQLPLAGRAADPGDRYQRAGPECPLCPAGRGFCGRGESRGR